MALLAIERLDTLPATLAASTLYIIRANESDLADIVVTGNTNSEVRHLLKRSDVVADALPLVAGTASVGSSLKLARQDHIHPVQTSVSGNAGSATVLETARSISSTGDVTWTIESFNGSANVTATATLKNDVVTAGTGTKLTYNSKGLITGKESLVAADIPSLDWSKITTNVPTFVKADGTVAMTGALTLSGDPTASNHATTKQYVDAIATGLRDFKESVRVVAISNISLSGLLSVDGVTLVAGDRVLVAGQTTGSQNGIYVVASGAWSRATDADTTAEITAGMFCYVEEGTSYAKSGWVLSTTDTVTVGTTALTFVQFNGLSTVTAGTGISISGNTVSLNTTGVTAAAYGSSSMTLAATVDAQGRLTSVSATNIGIAWSQITSGAPTSTAANIDGAVTNSHTHANKAQLDKVSEDASQDFKYNNQFVKARGIELVNATW